jgi:hypothetical protein
MSKEKSPFGVYTDMFQAWGDVYGSWAKSVSGMPFGATKELESWFKPFWGYFGDWGKIYESYTQAMKGFPWPYEGMRDYSDGATKAINSYVKIYDAWVRSMDKIGRKQLEIAQGLATGRDVKTAEIFDVLRESYGDISVSLVDSLKGTAFEAGSKGIEEVNKAVKQFADSFPEEEKQARETFQIFSDSFIKMMNSWNTSMMEASVTFSDMLGKGEISPNGYEKMIDMYGRASKESVGAVLEPLSVLLPGYKDTVDDVREWANKYFDMATSWFEVPLKLSYGIGKSSSEMYRFIDETFKDGVVGSPEEIYTRWSAFYGKATADLMEAAQFFTTLPKFTDNLVEYIKSTDNLYRRLMTPPFASKEDIDRVYSSIEKVRKMAERKAA